MFQGKVRSARLTLALMLGASWAVVAGQSDEIWALARARGKIYAESGQGAYRLLRGWYQFPFNYDSLVEAFLLRLGCWYPHDGYGVPVEVGLFPTAAGLAHGNSTSLVLHLHGTLYLYTSEFETQRKPDDHIALLVERDRPRYIFDPDSAASIFTPYEQAAFHLGHVPPEHRIVAPVRDKAHGLKEAFVRETYAKALGLVRACETLVAIGYSFDSHDRSSYDPLLQALGESRDRALFVVSPDASKLVKRLRGEYCYLTVEPLEETLRSWAAASFGGIPRARGRERQGA